MQRRAGFTLLEMLVAMALTLFIMVVVSTAFIAGLDTFRGLKGIGDMQQSLRMASHRLQADLQLDHFEGKRRLGDLAFVTQGRVQKGFFRIVKGNPIDEGVDLDGLGSSRAVDQVLHFSSKIRGDRPQDFFSASVPPGSPLKTDPDPTTYFGHPRDARFEQGNSYHSQWAEIAYYLVRTGSTTDPENPTDNTGTPLFALYRVQRVVVPRNDQLQFPAQQSDYPEFSCQVKGNLYFNTPEDLAKDPNPLDKTRSFNLPTDPTAGLGATLLLNNVISFQVQISHNGEQFHDLNGPEYDTAKPYNPTHRIAALQITIRVWDFRTDQTRQITIVQDM